MLVVSKIAVHPKKKGMYQIEFQQEDQGELLTVLEVHEDLIIKHGLRKGLPIPDVKLRELDDETEAHQVYQSALNYISYRMRSRKEVQIHLERKDYPKKHIFKVLDRLVEDNWIDDQAFAEAYVRSKKSLTSKGPSVIRQDLFKKGISEELIHQALTQYSEDDEREQALQFAEKKQKAWQGRSVQEQKQKLLQTLMQKGYSSEVSRQVADQLTVHYDTDVEWTALLKQGEKALYKYKNETGYERKIKIKQFLYRKGFQTDMIEKWINASID